MALFGIRNALSFFSFFFLIEFSKHCFFIHPNRSGLIIKNQKRISSVEEAISYFDLMASYLDELRKIQNHVREKIGYAWVKWFVKFIKVHLQDCYQIYLLYVEYSIYRNDVNENITNAKYSTYIGVAILAVVLVVSPVIIFLVRNATNTIQVGLFVCCAYQHCCLCLYFFSSICLFDFRFYFCRFMHVICRKKRRNWNVRNGKVTCFYFKCSHQASLRN